MPELLFIQIACLYNVNTNGRLLNTLFVAIILYTVYLAGEKDIGFEVSPDEVQAIPGGNDEQPDAIPTSSSSDSLSFSDETDARASLPTPSDILVSYSTFPGGCDKSL